MKEVDGFIITPTQKKIDILNFERLFRQNVPLVFIDRYIENVRKDYVIINSLSGSYKAVKYLVDKGYKHLACLAGQIISAPVILKHCGPADKRDGQTGPGDALWTDGGKGRPPDKRDNFRAGIKAGRDGLGTLMKKTGGIL